MRWMWQWNTVSAGWIAEFMPMLNPVTVGSAADICPELIEQLGEGISLGLEQTEIVHDMSAG
jgi:hypothetical protein